MTTLKWKPIQVSTYKRVDRCPLVNLNLKWIYLHVMISKIRFLWHTKCILLMTCYFLSYFIFNSAKTNGIVRVINRKTAERALLKDITGRVVDISFAYTSRIILGIADDFGSLYVYEINEGADGKITYEMRLLVNDWKLNGFVNVCLHSSCLHWLYLFIYSCTRIRMATFGLVYFCYSF